MNSIREATSTDGMLTLQLFDADNYYLGFSGCTWHTHGDLLTPEFGVTPYDAAMSFFDSILQDRHVICISDRKGYPRDIYISDDPQAELKYVESDEVFNMRLWSGAAYEIPA